MDRRISLVLVVCTSICLFVFSQTSTAQVNISVATTSGTPLRDALVIVQRLNVPGMPALPSNSQASAQTSESGHLQQELFRALTDQRGSIAPHALSPGLYRAIATFPYGRWQTVVQEFLVADQTVEVRLRMPPTAEGEDDFPVAAGSLTVHVVAPDGRAVVGAHVLLRDRDAHPRSERWGTTDAQGVVKLEITANDAVLIVIYNSKLYSFSANTYDTEETLRLK